MVLEILAVTVLAGAAGPVLGKAVKKSYKVPLIGRVSPAVIGTIAVAVGGLTAYYFRDKLHISSAWGERAKLAGVAGLGAFTAAMVATRMKKGARAEYAEIDEMEDMEPFEFQASGVPEERIAEYSRFTGPGQPMLGPTYYVRVID